MNIRGFYNKHIGKNNDYQASNSLVNKARREGLSKPLVGAGIGAAVGGTAGFLAGLHNLSNDEVTISTRAEHLTRPVLVGADYDPAHSYTGSAANLSLDLAPGGCWCEAMPDGTQFDHGRTVSIVLGEIRFHAPFGPLRDMATRADLIVTYPLVGGVVTPTWTFIVEGPGVGALAEPVDGVIGGGFARWIAHMDARAAAL